MLRRARRAWLLGGSVRVLRGSGELWGARRRWEALREGTGRAEEARGFLGSLGRKGETGGRAGGRQESLGLTCSGREALPAPWGSACRKSFARMPRAMSSPMRRLARSDEWETELSSPGSVPRKETLLMLLCSSGFSLGADVRGSPYPRCAGFLPSQVPLGGFSLLFPPVLL